MDIFTKLLGEYLAYLTTGFAYLEAHSWKLFGIIITIDITLTGISWMWLQTNIGQDAFKRLGMYIFYGILLTYWPTWTGLLAESFVLAGQESIGGASGFSILDPSAIIDLAIENSSTSFDLIDIDIFSPGTIPLALFSLFIIVVTFVSLLLAAILHFITVLEFYIVLLAAYFILPWGAWTKTAFISQNILGYLFASCIKLFVLALVITLNIRVGQEIIGKWSDELILIGTDLNEITIQLQLELGMLLFAVMTLMTVWKVPSYAAGLVSGGPTSSLGSFVATAGTLALSMMALSKVAQGINKTLSAIAGEDTPGQGQNPGNLKDATSLPGGGSGGGSGGGAETGSSTESTSSESSGSGSGDSTSTAKTNDPNGIPNGTSEGASSSGSSAGPSSGKSPEQSSAGKTALLAKKAAGKMRAMEGSQPRPKGLRTDDEDEK